MNGSWVPVIGKMIYKKKLVVRCGYELLRNWIRDSEKTTRWLGKTIFYFLLEMISYTVADKVFMSSVTDMKFIQERLRVRRSKIVLLRNYIDVEKFSPADNVDRSQVPELRDNRLLYIGRFIERKNLMAVLYALKDLQMVVAFAGSGDQEDELLKTAKAIGVKLELLGLIQNDILPKVINKHTFFILRSFYENSPKALLEGMACARVVIGSNVEGIKEVIVDGVNGFLCRPDADSIRSTILRAMKLRPNDRVRIGMTARDFILSECDQKKVFLAEKKIYKNLLRAS